jgi:HlyD family secretion protein
VAEMDLSQKTLALVTQKAEVQALASTQGELDVQKSVLQQSLQTQRMKRSQSETELAVQRLALERMVIRSPTAGRVMRLLAQPGQRKMMHMDHAEAATVAILYQPQQLQARIDVPLGEIAKLKDGQSVRLKCSALPDTVFEGKVTRWLGEADLQRNTLEVKVHLLDPDPRLRPEMLVRSEFLGMNGNGVQGGSHAQGHPLDLRIYVPETALLDHQAQRAWVWKLDATGKKIKKSQLLLASENREGHVLVREGLKPGDRVVDQPANDLNDGDRVRPSAVNQLHEAQL